VYIYERVIIDVMSIGQSMNLLTRKKKS